MRKAIQIFAVFFLVSMVAGSVLMMLINAKWEQRVTAMQADPVSRFLVESARNDIPAAAAFATAWWVWLGMAVVMPLGIVGVFWRRHLPSLVGAGLLIVAVVATVWQQPGIDLPNGNNPAVTGLGIAFFGVLGLLMVVLLHTSMKQEVVETELRQLY